jgi:hypothetical protein
VAFGSAAASSRMGASTKFGSIPVNILKSPDSSAYLDKSGTITMLSARFLAFPISLPGVFAQGFAFGSLSNSHRILDGYQNVVDLHVVRDRLKACPMWAKECLGYSQPCMMSFVRLVESVSYCPNASNFFFVKKTLSSVAEELLHSGRSAKAYLDRVATQAAIRKILGDLGSSRKSQRIGQRADSWWGGESEKVSVIGSGWDTKQIAGSIARKTVNFRLGKANFSVWMKMPGKWSTFAKLKGMVVIPKHLSLSLERLSAPLPIRVSFWTAALFNISKQISHLK